MFTRDYVTQLIIERSLESGEPVTTEDVNAYISDAQIEKAIRKGTEYAKEYTMVEGFQRYFAAWFIAGYLTEHVRIAIKVSELGVDPSILDVGE